VEEETEEHKELYELLQRAAVLMVKVGYTAISVTAEGKEEHYLFIEESFYMKPWPLSARLKSGTPPAGPGPKSK
jgi:hypothetical protein